MSNAAPEPARSRLYWRVLGVTLVFVGLVGPVPAVTFVPWMITGFRATDSTHGLGACRVAGFGLIAMGAVLLLASITELVRAGGTPAPVMPTPSLVVTGVYRWVRNPMYVAVISTLVGEALILHSLGVLAYAVAVFLILRLVVLRFEEASLRRRFGQRYDDYCRSVGRWLPRSSR